MVQDVLLPTGFSAGPAGQNTGVQNTAVAPTSGAQDFSTRKLLPSLTGSAPAEFQWERQSLVFVLCLCCALVRWPVLLSVCIHWLGPRVLRDCSRLCLPSLPKLLVLKEVGNDAAVEYRFDR